MKRSMRVINTCLGILFLIMGLSGLFHDILIEHGVYQYIHVPAAYGFFITACLHIWMNRRWFLRK